MREYSALCMYRSGGRARWRAEVPISRTESGLLVGWQAVEHYMRIFGWYPTFSRPLRGQLTPQGVTFTAVLVVFAREVRTRPEVEGIAWHIATPPEGMTYGN